MRTWRDEYGGTITVARYFGGGMNIMTTGEGGTQLSAEVRREMAAELLRCLPVIDDGEERAARAEGSP